MAETNTTGYFISFFKKFINFKLATPLQTIPQNNPLNPTFVGINGEVL